MTEDKSEGLCTETEKLCPICLGIHKGKSIQDCLDSDRRAHINAALNGVKERAKKKMRPQPDGTWCPFMHEEDLETIINEAKGRV